MSAPVFRFAPSPNGELHLGHAYSALLNRDMAERSSGRLLLRIEDIDVARCTPQFEQGIYDDLAWLDVEWEMPVRRQSEHFSYYRDALEKLVSEGLVYPAFMSRGDIRAFIADADRRGRGWPRDPDGVPHYPPLDRGMSRQEREARIASGEPFAWRLDTAAALRRTGGSLEWTEFDWPAGGMRTIPADAMHWGDVIIARKDIPTSYHLSVVLDDALQGVTDVVRGQDLYHATGIQRLLQALLDLPAPRYHHHRLILGPDGRKLSKSLGDSGLRALREAGRTPAEIRRLVGLD